MDFWLQNWFFLLDAVMEVITSDRINSRRLQNRYVVWWMKFSAKFSWFTIVRFHLCIWNEKWSKNEQPFFTSDRKYRNIYFCFIIMDFQMKWVKSKMNDINTLLINEHFLRHFLFDTLGSSTAVFDISCFPHSTDEMTQYQFEWL